MERNDKIKRFEYWLKARLGKIAFIEVQHRCQKEWYGNEYGGFYVNPTALTDRPIVYSFGIGQDISFDLAIIEKHNANVYGFDPTPKSIQWIAQQKLPDTFHFFPFGIGNKTEKTKFHLPINQEHVSGSVFEHKLLSEDNYVEVPLKSFSDIITETGHRKIDVLKMDIEGSEYLVIDDILNAGIQINQLLLETHERFFVDGKQKGDAFFRKLFDYGYRIFGISDTYQEISLIRV